MQKFLFVTLLLSFFFQSCNHLFYYPQKQMYVSPENVQLKYDNFTIKSTDNVDLNLWLIHAKNEKPLATIIHFHGNGENMSTHFLSFTWLAYLGFDIIEFDYRGYGLSTGIPEREGIIQDATAVMKWSQAHARTKDFFIIAQSLGGAVAVPSYVISKVTDINAIILESTFASYREIARKKLAAVWLTWPLQWPLSFLISDSFSSIDYIKDVHIPILFVHSAYDPVVPFESGYLLYEEAPEPKEFWTVPWSGHTAAFNASDNRFRKDLVGYLCQHLRDKNSVCDNLYKNYLDPVLKFSQ